MAKLKLAVGYVRRSTAGQEGSIGWCSNPRLQVFSLALNRLSYRPAEFNEKSPMSL